MNFYLIGCFFAIELYPSCLGFLSSVSRRKIKRVSLLITSRRHFGNETSINSVKKVPLKLPKKLSRNCDFTSHSIFACHLISLSSVTSHSHQPSLKKLVVTVTSSENLFPVLSRSKESSEYLRLSIAKRKLLRALISESTRHKRKTRLADK